MAKVLFVEDDASLRLTQTLYLEQEGFTVTAASGRRGARKSLEQDSFDLVVTDLRLGEASGIDVLRDTRSLQPEAEIIVITGYGSVESAVEAMKEGAYDYLTKPVDPEQLVRVLRKALERRALRLQVDHLQVRCAREAGLDGFVAVSPAMRLVLSAVDDVAATDATVLIEGESGTGKELIAKLIHQRSRRAMGPFLGINCGAMPENLLESELFGHVRGSFTGAHRDKKGLFEAAGGGTLFLDEIGELSPNFQVKLLRTLQEGTIRRVGDIRETFVDVRIIAASNRDLIGLVHEGAFRQDLYFRIKVVPIHLPPLRERREDILPLAEMFVRRLSDRMGRKPPELSPAAKEKLYGHCWPGNVRELENTLERALIFNRGDRLEADDFTLEACPPHPSAGFGTAAEDARDWRVSLEEIERRHILDVLERCGGNRTKAARILGIGTNTLWRKIKRYQEASGYDPTQT